MERSNHMSVIFLSVKTIFCGIVAYYYSFPFDLHYLRKQYIHFLYIKNHLKQKFGIHLIEVDDYIGVITEAHV